MGKQRVQIGSGRTSLSLAGMDPRPRRNTDEQQNSAARYGRSLTLDANDRLVVKPSRPVAGSSAEVVEFLENPNETEFEEQVRLVAEHNNLRAAFLDLQASYNLLLSELKRAGFVAGGN